MDKAYRQLKDLAIPLMREIDGPGRGGMTSPDDLDVMLGWMANFAESVPEQSHQRRVLLDFLPAIREASMQDLREAGKLMVEDQGPVPGTPGAQEAKP